MTPEPVPAWMSIAEEATKETNPAKLPHLIAQLCAVLEASTRAPKLQRIAP
jgi:hypothetical protein